MFIEFGFLENQATQTDENNSEQRSFCLLHRPFIYIVWRQTPEVRSSVGNSPGLSCARTFWLPLIALMKQGHGRGSPSSSPGVFLLRHLNTAWTLLSACNSGQKAGPRERWLAIKSSSDILIHLFDDRFQRMCTGSKQTSCYCRLVDSCSERLSSLSIPHKELVISIIFGATGRELTLGDLFSDLSRRASKSALPFSISAIHF